MPAELSFFLPDPQATERVGFELARQCTTPAVILLSGELGAGKTTFVRGFLRFFGITSAIKSPTYTLVESYPLQKQGNPIVHHFDCYRVTDSDEIEMLGVRDYFTENAICLVEWPEHGLLNVVKNSDLHCYLDYTGKGRTLRMKAFSDKANQWLIALKRKQQDSDPTSNGKLIENE